MKKTQNIREPFRLGEMDRLRRNTGSRKYENGILR
jgi:hypothetical protein